MHLQTPSERPESRQELRIFHIITSVWGEHHTRLFLDLTLPNVLSAHNLPALTRYGEVIYRFFTTPPAREHIAASKMSQRLASIARTEYVTPLGNRIPEPIWHVHWFHRAAAEAKTAGAIVIFVPPDTLWTDGAFASMAEHIAAGRRGVACPFILVTSETCVDDARASFIDPQSGILTISPSKMWPFARRHMHPLHMLAMPGAPHARPAFEMHWPVGEEGMLSRYAVREMVAFDPRRCPITFLWNADGPEDLKDLHFAVQPADMLMLSVDPLGKYLQNYILDHSCQPMDVARTSLHPLNDSKQTRLFLSRSVQVYSDAQNGVAWQRKERLARVAARDARVGRAAMLLCSKLIEHDCGQMADLLSVALLDANLSRRWRAEVPVTVFATCDKALSRDGCSSLRNLIACNCERELLRLILDHAIEGSLHDGEPRHTIGGTSVRLECRDTSKMINGVPALHGPIHLEGVELYVLDGIVANSVFSIVGSTTSRPLMPPHPKPHSLPLSTAADGKQGD